MSATAAPPKIVREFRHVLDFWFGPKGSKEFGQERKEWFKKDPAFDAAIRDRFGALHDRAAAGEFTEWESDPTSAIALLIVLDQFSRNLYRGDARAFAQDARALRLATKMVEQGWDRGRMPVERQFTYLPFEHAEDLAAQDRGIALVESLQEFPETRGLTQWAEKHRAIIGRFGRFPHRNAALGRASTPEEIEFLKQPGSSF